MNMIKNNYLDNFDHPQRFSTILIAWQKQHGRHTLPWQNTRDAYRIWLSEIMLQQTQVSAVIPYYQRFLQTFPTVQSLAAADSETVMAHWSGLGYYSRARNLHRCAQQIVAEYDGVFPSDPALLANLPGIGRSTAAAIAAFAYGTRAAILDGNVKRVFARVFAIQSYPGEKKVENDLWQRAEAMLPMQDIESYTQGLMDFGATLCTRSKPACGRCPMQSHCAALAMNKVNELPIRKPKKASVEKHTNLLLIIDTERNQVLLERRPALGIWGGLLSLPELDGQQIGSDNDSAPEQAMFAQAVAPFGTLASCQRLSAFTHAFTHFKLHIVPYRITLEKRLDIAGQLQHVWMDNDQLAHAALPAPVKKLLVSIS